MVIILNIDLKARLRNKAFLVAMISAIALLIQQLGFKDLIPENYKDVVNSILSILTMLGIVVDTSTEGISDVAISAASVEPKTTTADKETTES